MVLEMLRKLIKNDPTQKSRLMPLIFQIS